MEDAQTIISNHHKLIMKELTKVLDALSIIGEAADICKMMQTDLLNEPLAAATYKGLEGMGVYNLDDAQRRANVTIDYLDQIVKQVDSVTPALYDLKESIAPAAAAADAQNDMTGDAEQ